MTELSPTAVQAGHVRGPVVPEDHVPGSPMQIDRRSVGGHSFELRAVLVREIRLAHRVPAGVLPSRRRDCHFAAPPLVVPIETPTEGRGEVQQNDSLADG